ncbi:unnamed protein product, partial [Rhizoctonia solani]
IKHTHFHSLPLESKLGLFTSIHSSKLDMAGLLGLPPECIILVLLSLPPQEIARCKLVSRALWTVVNGSPILQYLLELDSLGFVAPRIVSKNLSLEEKIQMLRKSRRKIVVDAYDTIPVPLDWQGHNVLYFGCDFVLSRGVLALKSQKKHRNTFTIFS